MRFLLIASLAESLINFRRHLIIALQAEGIEVHVAAPDISVTLKEQLKAMDVRTHHIPLRRAGVTPITDAITLFKLWRLMRVVEPTYVLGYTVKPVIYGSLAAWMSRVPNRYALITGLGYAFQSGSGRGFVRFFVQRLYAIALTRVSSVFFQNPDDEALFRQCGMLKAGTPSVVINGSGVDVVSFAVAPLPPGPPRFLLIARLLGDKGVREYVRAARRIRAQSRDVRFALVGWIDENPDSIRQDELDAWVSDGTVDYLGRLSDVRPTIADCSVYVLPSYCEGMPRTVLESMAMGRPIITTLATGCRETVVDGENGLLVPVKSVDELEKAMLRFINDPKLISRMGARSRRIAEDKYDVRKVNVAMLRGMGICTRNPKATR